MTIESEEHIEDLDTMASQLERIGFGGGVWRTYDGDTSRTMCRGEAIAVVWYRDNPERMVGCVAYRGEEPCEHYWAAREITDPSIRLST